MEAHVWISFKSPYLGISREFLFCEGGGDLGRDGGGDGHERDHAEEHQGQLPPVQEGNYHTEIKSSYYPFLFIDHLREHKKIAFLADAFAEFAKVFQLKLNMF